MSRSETNIAGIDGAAKSVPLVDLAAQHMDVAEEVMSALAEVMRSGAFIGGPAVGQFETEYSRAMDVAHCVGVANGTDALELALRAVGVRPGGEVILPANTFVATAEAVARIGAEPVLVDVDEEHLLIDPDRVAEAVTARTQAIVPVHLFGQVAPVERLTTIAESCGAVIVEDAAQAQGARRFGQLAGSLGAAAGTSFYPGKNLGAAGDAGAVTTGDAEIAARVRLMAAHGSSEKYRHDVVGMNSRLDTVQAVVLRAKLRRLPEWNERRRVAAARYGVLLEGIRALRLPRSMHGNEDAWHLYVVRLGERDRVLAALQGAGIAVGIHYPCPVHLTKAFAYLGKGEGDFPVAEVASKEILSLPLFPHITVEQQEYVAAQLHLALGKLWAD
jgi:dTDP-4-amino-4,6-dideoxygalactose transaminase